MRAQAVKQREMQAALRIVKSVRAELLPVAAGEACFLAQFAPGGLFGGFMRFDLAAGE